MANIETRKNLWLLQFFFVTVGGIFYAIDLSTYYPIFGCIMLGVRSLKQAPAIGELARFYPAEQLCN